MRAIQMLLDEELVNSVDKVVKEIKITRSAFTRKVLREAINRYNMRRLEMRHRKGYKLHPVKKTEFSMWETEHDWGDK